MDRRLVISADQLRASDTVDRSADFPPDVLFLTPSNPPNSYFFFLSPSDVISFLPAHRKFPLLLPRLLHACRQVQWATAGKKNGVALLE